MNGFYQSKSPLDFFRFSICFFLAFGVPIVNLHFPLVFTHFEHMGAPDVRKETLQKSTFSTLGVTMSERCPLEGPKGGPRDPKSHPRDIKTC